MYVGEVVVDKKFEGGEGAYRFGIEDGVGREGCQCRSNIIGGSGRGEGALGHRRGIESALLDSFSMAIRRSSSSAGSVEGTWDVEGSAGFTWWASLIALRMG